MFPAYYLAMEEEENQATPACSFCGRKDGLFIGSEAAFICELCALTCIVLFKEDREKGTNKEAAANG